MTEDARNRPRNILRPLVAENCKWSTLNCGTSEFVNAGNLLFTAISLLIYHNHSRDISMSGSSGIVPWMFKCQPRSGELVLGILNICPLKNTMSNFILLRRFTSRHLTKNKGKLQRDIFVRISSLPSFCRKCIEDL